jgi:hypothetical protein
MSELCRFSQSEEEAPMSEPLPTLPPLTPEERNRLEMIRFASREAQVLAIQALLDRGMLDFSSTRDGVWMVYTPVARKLRELGVPFEWLTENVIVERR